MTVGSRWTIARTIAILLLVITALSYYSNTSWIPTLIAGLILFAPTAQKHLEQYINTLKQTKTLATTALYEALYWLLALITLYATNYFLKKDIPTQITYETIPAIATKLFITLTLALIILLLIYTLSRKLIWTTITKKEITYKKFLLLNVITWLPITIITIILAVTQAIQLLTGLFIIIPYFTLHMQAIYTRKQQIGQAISNGIAFAIAKLHKLIIPITYLFVTYLIIVQPIRLTTTYAQPAGILVGIIMLTLTRLYLYQTIKEYKDL